MPDGLHRRDLEGPARGGADRDGRARGARARSRSPTTGSPVASAGLMRRALAVQRRRRPAARAALRGADALARRADARGRRLRRARASPAGRRSPRALMVERDLALAAYEGRPVHLMHLSARESVDAVRRARAARRPRERARRRPHHLCATDELVRTLDANVKMNPPLRTEDDRRALVEALLDGTIDCVATDHAPHARHEKEVPFEEAPFGVTGLETAFARAQHVSRPHRRGSAGDAARAACRPGRRARSGCPCRGSPSASPRTSSLLDLEAEWTVRGGRLPLALGQLVAPRADARRRGREDGRRRQGGVRGVSARRHGYLLLEDGTVFRGTLGRGRGRRVRRGRLHDRDDRLPGDRHRPELRGAARVLHGADGRQLRRRPTRGSSPRRRTRAAVLMRRLGGEDWADWLAERGIVALDEIDTRALTLRLRDAGAMRGRRRRRRAGAPARRTRSSRCARSRRWRARRSSPQVSTPAPYVAHEDGRVPVALVDYGAKRSILAPARSAAGAAVTVYPHVPRPGRARRPRRRPALERARRPGAARRGDRGRSARRSAACRCSASASGTSCSASRPGTTTYKLPFGHRGANHPVLDRRTGRVLVTSQNHGFAVAPTRGRRGDARLALRRHGRGLRLPRAARARRVQFHPEAGPGAARRLADPRALGRGARER